MERITVKADWLSIDAELRAWYAAPAGGGPYPVVLCFIEAFGVTDHFREVAERFAEAGFCAVVPDIYHGDVFDYDDLDGALGRIKTLDEEQVMSEAAATLDVLAKRPECDTERNLLVGFCLGGRLAFRAHAVLADRVTATGCFYGGGIAPREARFGREPLLGQVERMRAPLMLFYGANDQSIRPDEHGRIAEALGNAGLRYGLQVFADTGHAFFCDARPSYNAAAAEESWAMLLDFFRRYSGS
ncbi:MAG TPA: dienelactone hydrolase family protein [Gammaproteobacteria bacterium]|nr:dienelactone hydrolase family protein [Gammaproteobacteria bacterium]